MAGAGRALGFATHVQLDDQSLAVKAQAPDRGRWGLAVSRSVSHPTRLETRTKESNMYASLWE